jgi:phospholipase/lecithinase/hemolysin
MRRILYENSLSLVFLTLSILSLVGQSLTDHLQHNEERREHGQPSGSYGQYLRTGHLWEAVTENWESEFCRWGSTYC